MFHCLPTLEELSRLEPKEYTDVIVVDIQDKQLVVLKELIADLVKGFSSNPPAMIEKIAGSVSDFYKRTNMELSPVRGAGDESSHASVFRGFQILDQIKHGTGRPPAILFKFLVDAVGLETRLMMGLPSEGEIGSTDSDKLHMCVTVTLNSVELLIDLIQFPGQLMPLSSKAIFMTHISVTGDSNSAENDSCDSPLEPNSPLYGFFKRFFTERAVRAMNETLQQNCLYQEQVGSTDASLLGSTYDRISTDSQKNVSDFYKRTNMELSPVRGAGDEASHASVFRGFQILGQIKHGTGRSRAILFEFLADAVGLETRLMMGLPSEGEIGCTDSDKLHMCVTMTLNSVELLIDLMRFPGQLMPLSSKAIFMKHISATGYNNFAENYSCDSPLEPNTLFMDFLRDFSLKGLLHHFWALLMTELGQTLRRMWTKICVEPQFLQSAVKNRLFYP